MGKLSKNSSSFGRWMKDHSRKEVQEDEYRSSTWSKYRSLKDNLDREAIKEYWEERAQSDE
jgi:hypothetical protein